MKLYHATHESGAVGIEEFGFTRSSLGGSAGDAWFCSSIEGTAALARGRGWIVTVEMPRMMAERHRVDYDNFKIPFHVVNSYQPFVIEPLHP